MSALAKASESAPRAQRRSITVGPGVAMHIINSQSGSLGRATLEYVMNACDAGSPTVDIQIDSERMIISDEGRGFETMDEIAEWFDVLCFDHHDDDHRIYGRFGMGRAQLFSYGSTTWRTRCHQMFVDVKNNGFDYDLITDLEDQKGCVVECRFYDPLSTSDIYATVREITDLALYCPIVIRVNGEVVSLDPKDEKWDHVTDEAYIRLKPDGELKVYNQGVFVRGYPGYHLGCGGVVVSKKRLEVNFARNDVMTSRCPVWQAVVPLIRGEAATAAKSKRLDDNGRRMLLAQWVAGDVTFEDVRTLSLIRSAAGRASTVKAALLPSGSLPVTLCPMGERQLGDSIHRQGLAWVLGPEMFEWFGFTQSGLGHDRKEELLEARLAELLANRPYAGRKRFKLAPFDQYRDLVDSGHEVVDEKALNKREKALLGAITHAYNRLFRLDPERGSADLRNCHLGESQTALGWTDGRSFIAIDRGHASRCLKGLDGIGRVVHTLIHEHCHEAASIEDHAHNHDFYERFHNLAEMIPFLSVYLCKELIRRLKRLGVKPNASLMKAADLFQESVAMGDDSLLDGDCIITSDSRPEQLGFGFG